MALLDSLWQILSHRASLLLLCYVLSVAFINSVRLPDQFGSKNLKREGKRDKRRERREGETSRNTIQSRITAQCLCVRVFVCVANSKSRGEGRSWTLRERRRSREVHGG